MTEGKAEEIKKLLETPFWIEGIESNVLYETEDDDSPPDEAFLRVVFSIDGDAWVSKFTGHNAMKSIRKRTYQGGGKDLRTRIALMILAYAMKLDEEERKAHLAKYQQL